MIGTGSIPVRSRRRARVALLVAVVLGATLTATGPAEAAPGEADLTTTLSSAPTPARPVVDGTAVIFLTVVNAGPEPATDVAVRLELPPGVHLADASTPCAAEGTAVACRLDGLEVGGQRTFRVDLDQLTEGTHPFTASASSDLADPDGSTSQHDLVVVPESADLVGLDRADQARVGSLYGVAHIFKDDGPTAAFGASLAGTFPANATVVPGSFEFGTGVDDLTASHCTVTATDYRCAPLTSNPINTEFLGAYVQYTLALPDTPQVVTAEATVTGRADPDPTNDTSTVAVTVLPDAPDLTVEWNGPRTIVAAGERFGAGATVSNVGEGTAEDVTVTFSAPEGWVVEALDIYQPACNPGDGRTVVCRYDRFGPGASAVPGLRLTAPPGATSSAILTVAVTSSTAQAGTAPDVDEAELDVLALGADLVASPGTTTPPPDPDRPSSTVTWGFRNASSDRVAADTTFTIYVPEAIQLVRLHATATPGTTLDCQVLPDRRGGRCVVAPGGYLYPGQEVAVTGIVLARVGGTYPLSAVALQSSAEAAPGDELSTAQWVIAPIIADLSVAALPEADEVTVGETFSYLARVSNAGPQTETAPTLDIEVPPGITVVSARRGWFQVPCRVSDQVVRCGFPPLQAGASNFVVVTAKATELGRTVTGLAVSGEQDDPDPSADRGALTLDAVAPGSASPVDLRLSIDGPLAEPVVAGQPFTAIVSIENHGPRTVSGVTVDGNGVTPVGVVIRSAAVGWFGRPCALDPALGCPVGSLAPGVSTFVVVTLEAPDAGPFEASFSVDGDHTDPDPTSDVGVLSGVAVAAGG